MHVQLRGFDILRTGGMENHLMVDVVRQDLTRELGKVTGPLTEETSFVLKHLLTDNAGESAGAALSLLTLRRSCTQ